MKAWIQTGFLVVCIGGAVSDKLKAEKIKASVRANVEHLFRSIKQVFGYGKVRYRGLAKNANRLHLLVNRSVPVLVSPLKRVNNMRLAFAISAHRDLDLLNSLIEQIVKNNSCYVFIHIDRKSSIPLNGIINNARVRVIDERIAVEWGDFSHVNAINSLFRVILGDDKSYDYVTLLSGQDLLIQPVDQLVTYLANNDQAELYMDISKMPLQAWGESGGFNRILYNYPKFFRKKYRKNHPLKIIRKIYNRLFNTLMPTKTLPSGIEFWGGSDWFTVSGPLLRVSLTYIDDNPWYDDFFKCSLLASEIYYPTLYMHIADKDSVNTGNNLKYIDWNNPDKSERGSPRTFEFSDKSSIELSGKFFARKFSSDKDKEIIDYFFNKVSNASSK